MHVQHVVVGELLRAQELVEELVVERVHNLRLNLLT